ncbi:phosphodiesterase [Aquabacterium sp. OR-4]|uniref:phosphodiesterase n=1 Tax=Aquabacterium sp. OR-4 TaxID=2978127 RepID=UPI0021B16568|nr:phosphodiesterase [Aquabacterium sp. OR-4]MDT7836562.1 phosphodiesterase [Aquabacterium sp. OR-4]
MTMPPSPPDAAHRPAGADPAAAALPAPPESSQPILAGAVRPATDPWPPLLAELADELAALPHAVGPDSGVEGRLRSLHQRAATLLDEQADAALYWLILRASHEPANYSDRHAWLCWWVARETFARLGGSPAQGEALALAALTMNCTLRTLQDRLAQNDTPPSVAEQARIDTHAVAAAHTLAAAGVGDALWLAIVRHHHDEAPDALPLMRLPPEAAAARLLRRVDRFAAALACRADRPPLSPVLAARTACRGADGTVDEIGHAMIGALGLYPPGSPVRLASGERGVVVGRGLRANLPRVAVVVDAQGSALLQPQLRDTGEPDYAVRGSLDADDSPLPLVVSHAQLLQLR